ncbi:MAG: energy-coupling factor ABC transporter ATP-binding protein [Chloroflexota bacterium]|nr:energy-coupling factor ABC transporter ATP-binding protein [Chloroflexota bacterium]
MNAVVAERLSYRFPKATVDALRDVTWVVEDGSVTLVSGPSGAGKTTLLRCLNGLIPHFHGGSFGGDVSVLGVNTRAAGPRDLARDVGMVFQDPEAQFVTDRVEDEIVFGMENLGYERQTMRVRLEETLDLLGINHLRQREVVTLSGGERQRVAIAAALATRPSMLVLDEPTSQLDPLAAHDVLAAVQRLNSDLGMTIVISEHRLDRVLPFADRLVAIDQESFAEGPLQDVLPLLDDVPPLVELARALGWRPVPLTIRDARRILGEVRMPDKPLPNRHPEGTRPEKGGAFATWNLKPLPSQGRGWGGV